MPKIYQRKCAVCGKHFDTLDRLARYCPSHTSIEEIFNEEKRSLAKCAKCGSTCSSIRKASTELDGVVGYCPRCQEWADIKDHYKSPTSYPKISALLTPLQFRICKLCGKTYPKTEDSVLICSACDALGVNSTLETGKQSGTRICPICKKEYLRTVPLSVTCPACSKTSQPQLQLSPTFRKCSSCDKDFLAYSKFAIYCPACIDQIKNITTITINPDSEKTFLPGKSLGKLSISIPKKVCPVCNKNELKDDTKVCEPCRLDLIKTPQKNNQKPKPKPGQRKVQYK